MPRNEIELLEDTHGLSCIENHFIATLKHNQIAYKTLYKSSFVSVNIVQQFINGKSTYSYFSGIDRLHVVAEKMGLGRIEKFTNYPFDLLISDLLLSNRNREIPILARVNPKQLPGSTGQLPWRNDHYVSLWKMDDQGIRILDDYPKRLIVMSASEFREVYCNEIRIITLAESSPTYCSGYEDIKRIIKGMYCNLEINVNNYEFSIEQLQEFRDAVGILRISRKRLIEFVNWVAIEEHDTALTGVCNQLSRTFSKSSELLDNLYAISELYRIRKRINYVNIFNILQEFVKLEWETANHITKEVLWK